MNQSSHLYQLQIIDLEIQQVISRLSEIDKEISDNTQLIIANEDLNDCKKKFQIAQQTIKSLESDQKEITIKIETSEASLYGGKIHNPKELMDLQTEISSLKRRLSVLEEEIFQALVTYEENENKVRDANDNLTQKQLQKETSNTLLIQEKNQVEKRLEKLQTERAAQEAFINPKNLSIYQHLREQKRGLAVALIEDTTCTGCGTSLRPAEIQSARSADAMTYCSTCGRILFAR